MRQSAWIPLFRIQTRLCLFYFLLSPTILNSTSVASNILTIKQEVFLMLHRKFHSCEISICTYNVKTMFLVAVATYLYHSDIEHMNVFNVTIFLFYLKCFSRSTIYII